MGFCIIPSYKMLLVCNAYTLLQLLVKIIVYTINALVDSDVSLT